MAFEFSEQRAIERQVRKLAKHQIDKALQDCADPGKDIDATVHKLRRRCKKLRGLVRLIKPRFAGYSVENAAFRDAARELSGARDALVMRQSFAQLSRESRGGRTGRKMPRALSERVEKQLKAQGRKAGSAGNAKAALARVEECLRAARKRVGSWRVQGDGFAQIGEGLHANYRRMVKDMAKARKDPVGDKLHAWRKSTKYHGHHIALLQPAAPELLGARGELVDARGDLLGDYNNLEVLGTMLETEHKGVTADELALLRNAIGIRQSVLAERAFALGEQLTAEKPGALRRRMAQYWSLLPKKA